MPDGYGQFGIGGRGNLRLAHRVAFDLSNEVPLGAAEQVRHTCDNPPCCNPAHLLRGDNAANVNDREARGRTARGSRHPAAKLTEAQAREIRALYASGAETQKQLAHRFGVSTAIVGGICRGRRWRHVA